MVEIVSKTMEQDICSSDSSLLETKIVEADVNLVPHVGMEFESIEAAQKFYNDHAKCTGFGIRIQNSRKEKGSEEVKYILFVCTKEGFKREKEKIECPRAITRIGCMARMRLKRKEMKFQVTEVVLEHNHQLNPSTTKYYRYHKNMDVGLKRKFWVNTRVGVRKHEQSRGYHDGMKKRKLELKQGDVQALLHYFRRMHREYSRFFFTIDIDFEDRLKHIFWVDPRSRASYEYFADVVMIDTTCLLNKSELKCVLFVGVNHHGQSLLFGCGLIAYETRDSFVWLFNAFLDAMGRPPSALITDQCQAIQEAVEEVFPNARHRLCLWHIMKKVPKELGALSEFDAIMGGLKTAIYDTLKVDDFEKEWGNVIKEFKLEDNEWLNTLYELRHQWVPVFVKNTFYAGMSTTQQSESITTFFDGYVLPKTCLKEFLPQYELALQRKWEKEEKANIDSCNTSPIIKTFSHYEVQLAEVYSREVFLKFQEEVMGMTCCSAIKQVMEEGRVIMYMVKQNAYTKDGCSFLPREYEVFFNKEETEVRCICRLFQHKGYLCRHALYILNFNEVVEIPSRYILPRWRKDFKHIHSGCSTDVRHGDKGARYADLFKKFTELVEEGVVSNHGYEAALKVYHEGFERIRDANKRLHNDSVVRHAITEESSLCAPSLGVESDVCGDTTMEHGEMLSSRHVKACPTKMLMWHTSKPPLKS